MWFGGGCFVKYRDIVECIKLNQIRQNISNRTLAVRLGVSETTITEIRGYRMKVSRQLFEKVLMELSIKDVDLQDKEELLRNQNMAKKNRQRRYEKEKERK